MNKLDKNQHALGKRNIARKREHDSKRDPKLSRGQHVIEVADVANGQPQDFDLGELLVGWKGGQQFAQIGERRVERLDAEALARRVGRPVLWRGAPPTPAFFAREAARFWSRVHQWTPDAAESARHRTWCHVVSNHIDPIIVLRELYVNTRCY